MVALHIGDPVMAVPSRNAPLVWVLHDGKPGMASQALGLAEATGFPFVEKQLSVNRPWAWLPPQLWLAPLRVASEGDVRLAPPWPDLVIGCGRHSAMPALAIRRASGGRTFAAQVQDPRIGRGKFDLLFVPEHDRLRGPRVVVTRGAIHRVTPVRLTEQGRRFPGLAGLPRPILGVLIGGANRSYRLGLDRLAAIAEAIAAILRAVGGSAVVTPSRRTGAAGLALLRQHLARHPFEFVFTTPSGTWLWRSTFIRRVLRPAIDGNLTDPKPGVRTHPVRPGLTFHGLRHSRKTWMIADGIPEIAQARRLGHRLDNRIVETYSHVAPEVERRLIHCLERRWREARTEVDRAAVPPAAPGDQACSA